MYVTMAEVLEMNWLATNRDIYLRSKEAQSQEESIPKRIGYHGNLILSLVELKGSLQKVHIPLICYNRNLDVVQVGRFFQTADGPKIPSKKMARSW